MRIRHWFVFLAVLGVCLATRPATAQPSPVETLLRQVIEGSERHVVAPIGLTASGRPIVAFEPRLPAVATQRRVVVVAGLDGDRAAGQAVIEVLSRSLRAAASSPSRRWQVAAVPCALPERCDGAATADAAPSTPVIAFPPEKGFFDAPEFREARYLWRWATMLGPDLVIEVRAGDTLTWRANALAVALVPSSVPADAASLAGALGRGAPSGLAPVAALELSGPPQALAAALETLLDRRPPRPPSALKRVLTERQARTPLATARMLAARYPATPSMSYIPALSWSGALRLSALTGDPQYRERAMAQMQPFVAGTTSSIAEPYQLTSLAGHQALFDLASEAGGNAAADAVARKAADFILGTSPDQAVRFATTWTDDMFMATSVLARAAARTGDARYADAVAGLLTASIDRLQRDDRLFIHAQSGPHAWGRGNGFAAFGLMEALTHLPASWPAHPRVLDSFQRLMAAMRRHQAPDGSWHQVVDDPATYRELTVTAMTVAAMARGVRLGWLDASYRQVVEAGWRAVQARVSDTGELVDVCAGTGAGANATREYYRQRPALFGADDRGGAMALTAALEVHVLGIPR